jgi:hypothetical protein
MVFVVLFALSPEARAADMTSSPAASERPEIIVYKSPYCGCCAGWIDYIVAHGYSVTTRDIEDPSPVKKLAGVPEELRSCHTASIAGYTLEGHVPAQAIHRLLKEQPEIKGLAVPGMPAGSPGMQGPEPEPYDVLAFRHDGKSSVFMSIPASP